MSEQFWSRRITIFALPVIVVLFLVTAGRHFNYTPDDTYIYLQFARNAVLGNGLSFNAGTPTYGFTSPLWLLLISLSGRAGVELYTAAKALDIVCAGLALVVFYQLAGEVIRDLSLAICATVAFSLNSWFLRWTGTGMETSLSVLLLLSAVLMCLRNRYFLAMTAAALLALARPEALALPVLILADLFLNSHDRRAAARVALPAVAVCGAILVPWFVYAKIAFGTVVPNTALAKAGLHFSIDEFTSSSLDLGRTLMFSDGVAVIVLLIAGLALPRRLRVVDAAHAEFAIAKFVLFRQSFVAIGWIMFLALVYTLSGVNVVSRYLLLMTPLVTIYAFWYLQRLIAISRWSRFTIPAMFLLTAAIMLQSQVVYGRYVLPGIEAFETGMESSLLPIGRWLHDHTPPESVVYAPDVGAVGYFSGRRICDGAGLVSPDMLALVRRGYTEEMMMGRRAYAAPPCSAQYVVDRSFEPERWKADPGLQPVMTRPFPQMGLGETRTNYYTVYKVLSTQR